MRIFFNAIGLLLCFAGLAHSQFSAKYTLNVEYDNQDYHAGGRWELYGESSHYGFYSALVFLKDIQRETLQIRAPRGLINGGTSGAGFSQARLYDTGIPQLHGYGIQVWQQNDIPLEAPYDESMFYCVGSMFYADAYPAGLPHASLFNTQGLPWGGHPGFGAAVLLFSGTFVPGQHPQFSSPYGFFAEATIFRELPLPGGDPLGSLTSPLMIVDRVTNLLPGGKSRVMNRVWRREIVTSPRKLKLSHTSTLLPSANEAGMDLSFEFLRPTTNW